MKIGMRTKIFVIAILTFCLFLTGCGAKMESVADKDVRNESTFVIVENGRDYKIVYHRDTKVMYAISRGSYNSGDFTVMVDKYGKPLLYQGDQEDADVNVKS
jgi:hypothetical protein